MQFVILAVLLGLFGSSLADRSICPHPDETGNEVAQDRITLGAPTSGHATLEIDLSARVLGRELSCFSLMTESQNTGPHSVALGKNFRGGFSVKIITEERRGLQAQLQAYLPRTPSPVPPTPQPYPPVQDEIVVKQYQI